MKKIILALILSAGFCQLKAQQLLKTKPDSALSNGLNNYFKPNTKNSLNQLLTQLEAGGPLNNLKTAGLISGNITVYNNMPVVKTKGYDNMPIVTTGEPGVNYTMLVKKITVMRPGDQVPALTP
jgi:hypothetical protein